MGEAVATRPYMPGYGVLGPNQGRGLLPWSWAEDRLVRSHDYWVATVGPGTLPHVTPVWGVWADGAGWFSSSRQSRKARNIGTRRPVVLTTDDPSEPVMVEGDAVLVDSGPTIEAFTGWVNAKYESDLPVSFFVDNACFRVTPRRVIALDEADFTGSPTRWVFAAAP